jgi:hypothetical protein
VSETSLQILASKSVMLFREKGGEQFKKNKQASSIDDKLCRMGGSAWPKHSGRILFIARLCALMNGKAVTMTCIGSQPHPTCFATDELLRSGQH